VKRSDFLWILPSGLILGASLALVSPGAFLSGWLAFSLLALLSLIGLRASHSLAGGEKTLAWILIVAFALRLALGVGSYLLEPVIGHDNKVNQAGYLFTDAYTRDTQAWDLASSTNSLMNAFDQRLVSDQYGGMLFTSSVIYRYISPDAHRPLLVTLLAALFGTLGVAFVWATGKRISSAALLPRVAALIFAFYPEAILQGAAQMREPFLMTFIAISFYGVVEWQASRARLPWLWMLLGLAGMLLFSPGFILATLVIAGGWLYFSRGERRIPWQGVVVALVIFGIALIALSLSWNNLVADRSGGPLGIIGNWARDTARWNQQILKGSSGIVQLLFDKLPAGIQIPFVALYGILQPVLPAAIFDASTPFWQILGIFRALGWYILLPFVAYAPFSAWDMAAQQKRRWLWLGLAVWIWILIAALRGGADQWDNPRYRVILLAWEALIAAQAFLALKQGLKRWWLRILWVEAIVLLVFTHWYMYRYLNIGFNIGIRNTLILAIGLSLLLVLGDWLVEKWRTWFLPPTR